MCYVMWPTCILTMLQKTLQCENFGQSSIRRDAVGLGFVVLFIIVWNSETVSSDLENLVSGLLQVYLADCIPSLHLLINVSAFEDSACNERPCHSLLASVLPLVCQSASNRPGGSFTIDFEIDVATCIQRGDPTVVQFRTCFAR